ncbi:MAG: hypothetical protein NTW21_23165 [Verrucomicrobia bacterium]|nr:hypothetical protein [Verrucomicrobiota bacterium]
MAKLRPCRDRQSAFVVLRGVAGLQADTPGTADTAKTTALLDAMPARLVKFPAGEIRNLTYAQGDPADFLTSAASPPSPGCGPSPKPNPPAQKRR